MNFIDICSMFNRAFWLSFSKKKLLLVFLVLISCGLFATFCRSLGFYVGTWISMSLVLLPIFLSTAVLFSIGILLIRLYHDEIKMQESSLRAVMIRSWQLLLGSLYLTLPLFIVYLLLWFLFGVCILLRDIPAVGTFVGSLISFVPFLLFLGALVLIVASIALLFFASPVLALREKESKKIVAIIIHRLKDDVCGNLIYFLIAMLPGIFACVFLVISAVLIDRAYLPSDILTQNVIQVALQWLVIMIPFAAILSPFVVFFFNFAAEAHIACKKRRHKGAEKSSNSAFL